jgi:translation initiation factor 2 subunit 1
MDNSSSDEGKKPDGHKGVVNCRFYRQQFPKANELVMVEVKHVDQMGASVSLLEYNNIEGLIMLGELSRKRIRSINKLTRVGRKEVVAVIRVDESKGYLDLSKKQVTPEDIDECEKKYRKAKSVNNILRRVSQTQKIPLEALYETIGWPLYEKYEHALDAFGLAITDDKKVFEDIDITEEVKEELIKVIKTRLSPQPIKIRADFSVTCFEYEGIDAIKAALVAGMSLGRSAVETKIRLIAAPLYVMIITVNEKNQGLDLARSILKKISEEIKERGGNFMIKDGPNVLNTNDDHELEEMIHKQNNIGKAISDIDEDNDEGMGDVDIGIDIDEIDAKNAAEKPEDDEDEEEEEGKKN